MKTDYFFYRKFNSSEFIQTKPIDPLKEFNIVLVKTSIVSENPKAFCPTHRQWENVKSIKHHKIIFECGTEVHGLIAEYFINTIPISPISNEPLEMYKFSHKEQIWDSLRFGNKIFNPIGADMKSLNLISRTPDSVDSSIYREMNNQHQVDENCINIDYFAYSIHVNEKKKTVFIKGFFLDREKIDDPKFNFIQKIPYKTSQYNYNLEKGESSSLLPAGIPAEVAKAAVNIFKSLFKDITGININVCSEMSGETLLSSLNQYPFEANLAPAIRRMETLEIIPNACKFQINNRMNPDCYNNFCKFIDITSYRTLRKMFNKNPLALMYYTILTKQCGFTDKNIINSILSFKNLDFFINCDSEDFAFFCQQCIREKSEKKTAIAIKKFGRNNEYSDGIYMFHKYYSHINYDVRNQIYKVGFTQYNHDVLSKIAQEAESENVIFTYTDEQKKLEDEINDYKFRLAPDSDKLIDLGVTLHNCVASYKHKVLDGKCIIVYVEKDGKNLICIEIRGNTIWQQRMNYNSEVTGYEKFIMQKYQEAHKLNFTSNKF